MDLKMHLKMENFFPMVEYFKKLSNRIKILKKEIFILKILTKL
jgi:hypothetical protein